MVLVTLVVMILAWSALEPVAPVLGSSVRLFLTVIVGTTLEVDLDVMVGVALGLGEAVGVGVVKESTSSSLGETASCLVTNLGRVLLVRV